MYDKITIFNQFNYKITKHHTEKDGALAKYAMNFHYCHKDIFKKLPLVFQLEWRVLQQLKQ